MRLRFEKPTKILRFFLPALAVAFAAVFVFAWISIVSAKNPEYYSPPPAPNFQSPYELDIQKLQNPQLFTVGTSNTYIINILRLNEGIGPSGFSIEDPLPAGMSLITSTISGANWDCRNSTLSVLNCFYTRGITETTIINSISFNVEVHNSLAGNVTNTAYLRYGSPTITKSSSIVTTVANGADLSIQKDHSPSIIATGGLTVTYLLTVTNHGPDSAAVPTVVTDALPAAYQGYPFDISAPGGVITNVSVSSGITTVRWTINSVIAPNATINLSYKARLKSNASGTVTNQARVSNASTVDWRPTNNTGSSTLIVGGLRIGKTASVNYSPPVTSTQVLIGQNLTYTILLTNVGSATISGITITDVITNGLTYLRSDRGGSFDSASRVFTLRNISIGGNSVFALHLYTRPDNDVITEREITNVARAAWGSFAEVSNPVFVNIKPSAALTVLKTDGLSTLSPGQTYTYTIQISNTGNVPSDDRVPIRITDTFSTNLAFVKITKGNQVINDVSSSNGVKIWEIPNYTLQPSRGLSFHVSFKVASNAANNEQVTNQVRVGLRDESLNQIAALSGLDVNTVQFAPAGSITIQKSVSPELAQVGESFTFKIEVRNNGNIAVNNVIINDYFPEALDLTSATASRGTAQLNTATREVEVRINPLNPDERATIIISARVNATVKAPRTYRNRAYLDWDNHPGEVETNGVPYRVYPSGTLPGTGGLGLAQSDLSLASPVLAGVAALLLFAGLALLVAGVIRRLNHPLSGNGTLRLGLILLFGAFLCGALYFMRPRNAAPPQLSLLGGQKPPVASPLPVLPGSTVEPLEPSEPAPPIVIAPEPTAELLELRPTPEAPPPVEPLATPTLTAGEIDLSHLLPTPTPLNLPDFPIPTPTGTNLTGPNGGEADTSAITRISIPAMQLVTNVKYVPFSGSTWLISGLKQEVAWMGDTSWPGVGGNTGLAGHVDLVTGERGPFWNLKNLKIGDEVVLQTQRKIYTYRVRSQAVVDDHDLSVIKPTDKPQLTLITCTGWDTSLRLYLKRLVVFADLLSVQPLASASNQ